MADEGTTILNASTYSLDLSTSLRTQEQINSDYLNTYLRRNKNDVLTYSVEKNGSNIIPILYKAGEIKPIEQMVFTEEAAIVKPITVASVSPSIPSIRGNIGQDVDTDYMQKIDVNDPPEGLEIRPALQQSQGIPMYLEMIDSDFNKKGIVVDQNYIVTTLKLNPNPEALTVNSSKKTTRYTTMTRWVEEHWGDEIDTISFNGSTFSFFATNPDAPDVGLTYAWRELTASYDYLKMLVKFFQLNGCLYHSGSDYELTDQLNVSEFLKNNPEFVNNHPYKGMIKERMYLRLVYDYMVFIGRFDSFDIIEDSKSPFRFMYNTVFKAEKTIYLLDKSPESGADNPNNTIDSRLNLNFIAPTDVQVA